MNDTNSDLSTDRDWEQWGRRDPYFGVITDPKFRRGELTAERKREFFDTGASHVEGVLSTIRKHIAPKFSPKTILDFGCGVGRLLVPFAKIAEHVVGLDVSPTMLEEARRNCDEYQLTNVQLLPSDDDVSALTKDFDLIHSCIVFQHIPVDRGRKIFASLLRRLRHGGVGAIHITYAKSMFPSTHGAPPISTRVRSHENPTPRQRGVDPEMQMNPYNMNEILFLMQTAGIKQFHADFSDHGGELGVFLLFQRPME
jgi:SAM-dependent methyltransferase